MTRCYSHMVLLCDVSPSRYGFGLPLARLYARYFGGNIHIQSMYGVGTDVYVNLNHLGNVKEGLDVRSTGDPFTGNYVPARP